MEENKVSGFESVDGLTPVANIKLNETDVQRVGNIIICEKAEKGECMVLFPDYACDGKSALAIVLERHGIEPKFMQAFSTCEFIDGGILTAVPIPVEKIGELFKMSSELFMEIKKAYKKGNISGKALSDYIDAYEEDIRENGFAL